MTGNPFADSSRPSRVRNVARIVGRFATLTLAMIITSFVVAYVAFPQTRGPITHARNVVKLMLIAPKLLVNVSADSPKSTIILGASHDVPILKVDFTAKGQGYVVYELTLFQDRKCNWCKDRVAAAVHVRYVDEDGATVTKTGFLDSGRVVFDVTGFYVPAGARRTVTVTVDTNPVGGTAVSLVGLQLVLDGQMIFAYGDVTNKTAKAEGVAPSKAMGLRSTKPVVSLASGSPSGAGVPGFGELLRFNVTADSRGAVRITELPFKISASDRGGFTRCENFADPKKWEIYDLRDPNKKLDLDAEWVFQNVDGNACQPGEKVVYADAYDLDIEIKAGATETFVLRGDTTGASPSNDDSIRIDLPDASELASTDNGPMTLGWQEAVEDRNGLSHLGDIRQVTGGTIVY